MDVYLAGFLGGILLSFLLFLMFMLAVFYYGWKTEMKEKEELEMKLGMLKEFGPKNEEK